MVKSPEKRKRVMVALSWELPGQIEGIVRYAYRAGWSLRFVGPSDGDEIRTWKPDGLVCQLYHRNPQLVAAVREARVPAVDLYTFVPDLRVPRIRVDHTALGRAAAEHFLERRFRRLVHVGRRAWPGDNNFIRGFEERAREEAMEVVNVMVDDPARKRKYRLLDGRFGLAGDRYPAFIGDLAEGLTREREPAGVFSQSSLLALDLIDALLARRIPVPEQVAVLTFWERPDECELARIPVSYIREDYPTQGYRAAETLERLMQGKVVPAVQWIPPLPAVTLESTDTLAMTHRPTALAMKHLREHALEMGFAPKLAAQNLGITLRTLQRWFDLHVGQSPADYIEARRADRAAGLLKTSTLSVPQVAHLAGFTDQRQLSRALERRLGCTPHRLRESMQKKAWQAAAQDRRERGATVKP